MNEIKRLEEEGKKEEAEQLRNRMIEGLEEKLEELERKNESIKELDRSKIPQQGEILAESNRIVLRMISKNEEDFYNQLYRECSELSDKHEEALMKNIWSSYFANNACVCTIYTKESGDYRIIMEYIHLPQRGLVTRRQADSLL